MSKVKFCLIYVYPIILVAILHLVCVSCQENDTNLNTTSNEITDDSNRDSQGNTTEEPSHSGGLRCLNRVANRHKAKPPKRRGKRKSAHDHCLIAHNKYRAMHGAPPMKTDPEILKWANKRAREIVEKFDHVKSSPFGENLAMHSAQHISCPHMVKMWYDEIKDYNFSKPGFSMKTGHFTQLVWKNSVRLGCGYYTSKKGTYLSCGYGPHGNVMGAFEKNVSPKGDW